MTQADVDAADAAVAANLQTLLDKSKADTSTDHSDFAEAPAPVQPPVRELSTARLVELNDAVRRWPATFTPHPRLAKQLRTPPRGDGRRRQAIDWGLAEALAFASILSEGTSIRFSGQDVERGILPPPRRGFIDVANGGEYIPLQHVGTSRVAFEIYNSALSEMAVMGFEYGYSCAAPDTLTLWEGQFGDFANVAQPIIDQFLSADRAKWGQDSGLVLLLPHGYEGQGPEHSSARLELVPADVRGGKHARRVSVHSGAVLSHHPQAGGRVVTPAADPHAAQVAAASGAGGELGDGSFGAYVPAGDRRSHRWRKAR